MLTRMLSLLKMFHDVVLFIRDVRCLCGFDVTRESWPVIVEKLQNDR